MNLSFWLEHWQEILTALVAGMTLLALLLGRRAPDMTMLGAVIVLLAFGILSPAEALSGMSNQGMLTVAALFVVAAAVHRTELALLLIVGSVDRISPSSPSSDNDNTGSSLWFYEQHPGCCLNGTCSTNMGS